MSYFVSLITVNYNGKRHLKTCLDSCFDLNYPKSKLEVIVVDNGSTDGSVEFINKHYPKVKLLQNDVNNYCRANNLGIKQAKGKYIGLINNDVRLEKNWLIELLEVAKSNHRIGAVTSKILFPDKRINSTGHVELPNLYWADRGFKEKDRGQYNRIEEIESLSHCACLYNRDCLKEIGLLDEDFNMYLEDVDMSIRAKKKGWRLFYVPEAICYHRFHGTIDKDRLRFYIERNRLFLLAKHYVDRLEKALFNDGCFSIVGKLEKDFWLSVLDEVSTKMVNGEKEIYALKKKVEGFHQSRVYRFFLRPAYRIFDFTFFDLKTMPAYKPKILHIIQSYPPTIGGAGMWCQGVCRYLAQNGHRVKVLTLNGGLKRENRQELERRCSDNIEVIRCKKIDSYIVRAIRKLKPYGIYKIIRNIWAKSLGIFFSGSHSIEMYFKMFKEIKNTDIVHLHIMPYLYNFLGFFIAKFYKKKIAITPYFHQGNFEHERKTNFWLMQQCDAVFALTDYEKEYFIDKGLDERRVFNSPCAIELEDYRPKDCGLFKDELFKRYAIAKDTKIVIFIGRKMRYKGLETLVEAIRKLRREIFIKLFLVGPDFPWFNEYYSKLSVEDKKDIIDFGTVSHQVKVNLLHLSDVLVLPSKFEAFGIVILEAWACGLPVLGIEGGTLASVIKGGGLTARYGNIDDLAGEIKIILTDRYLRENLSENVKERIRNYTWPTVGKTILDAYLSIYS